MTEITEKKVEKVKAVPFAAALILAPLVPAALGNGLALLVELILSGPAKDLPVLQELLFFVLVPAVAVLVGGPGYLVFGGPMFWRTLARGRDGVLDLVGAGLRAHALSMIVVLPAFLFAREDIGTVLGFFALGLLFAPLWSAIFALLYRRFTHLRKGEVQ